MAKGTPREGSQREAKRERDGQLTSFGSALRISFSFLFHLSCSCALVRDSQALKLVGCFDLRFAISCIHDRTVFFCDSYSEREKRDTPDCVHHTHSKYTQTTPYAHVHGITLFTHTYARVYCTPSTHLLSIYNQACSFWYGIRVLTLPLACQ